MFPSTPSGQGTILIDLAPDDPEYVAVSDQVGRVKVTGRV